MDKKMQQHALLYRHRQRRAALSPIVSRQPLVAHVARQRHLPSLLLPFARPISTRDEQGLRWKATSAETQSRAQRQFVEATDYEQLAPSPFEGNLLEEKLRSAPQQEVVLEQPEQHRLVAQAPGQAMQHTASIKTSHLPPKEDVQRGKGTGPSLSKREGESDREPSYNTSWEGSPATEPRDEVTRDAQNSGVTTNQFLFNTQGDDAIIGGQQNSGVTTDQLVFPSYQDTVDVEQPQEQNMHKIARVQRSQEEDTGTMMQEEKQSHPEVSSQEQHISVPPHINTAEATISHALQLPVEPRSVPSPTITMPDTMREATPTDRDERTEEHTAGAELTPPNDTPQPLHQDRVSAEQPQEQNEQEIARMQERQESIGPIIHNKSSEERRAGTNVPQLNGPLQSAEVSPQQESQQASLAHDQGVTLNQPQQQGQRTQPVEIVSRPRTRPPRARIEEQPQMVPSRAQQERTAPTSQGKRTRETVAPATNNEGRPASATDLFAPQQEADRSPQAWAARLRQAAGMAPTDEASSPGTMQERVEHQPQVTQRQELTTQAHGQHTLPQTKVYALQRGVTVPFTPSPLSQRTRRFLQPLVGIDPATVRVYRNELTEQLTEHYQADAITTGEDVLIGTGYPEDSAEMLGLLAHEFTHIARQRTPQFVPPITRIGGEEVSAPIRPSPQGNSIREDPRPVEENRIADAAMQAASQDEEGLALRVEGKVTQVARKRVEQHILDTGPSPDEGTHIGHGITNGPSSGKAPRSIWGNLPTPWDPLPDWLIPPPSMQHPTGPSTLPATQPVFSTAHSGNSDGRESLAGLQRAASDRSIQEEVPVPTIDTSAIKTPEVDLDMLARQVYSRLKRRLGVERRRESEGE